MVVVYQWDKCFVIDSDVRQLYMFVILYIIHGLIDSYYMSPAIHFVASHMDTIFTDSLSTHSVKMLNIPYGRQLILCISHGRNSTCCVICV